MLSVILVLFAGNIGGQTHEYMTPSAHGLCCTCDFRNVLYVLRHAMLGVAAIIVPGAGVYIIVYKRQGTWIHERLVSRTISLSNMMHSAQVGMGCKPADLTVLPHRAITICCKVLKCSRNNKKIGIILKDEMIILYLFARTGTDERYRSLNLTLPNGFTVCRIMIKRMVPRT